LRAILKTGLLYSSKTKLLEGSCNCLKIFILFVPLLLVGCATHHGITIQQFGKTPVTFNGDTSLLPRGIADFTVSPGDVYRVEINQANITKGSFRIEANTTLRLLVSFERGNYRIMPGDRIKVDFIADSSLNFEAGVRPDGKITIPRIGEITAKGKTTEQLAKDIARACEKQVNDPRVTVSLVGMNRTAINNISGEFVVSPDGKIIVPLLGEVQAKGRTPKELSERLTILARRKLGNNFRIDVIPRRLVPRSLASYDRTVTVTPSGEIMLPLAGNIKAIGLTLPQLRARIRSAVQEQFVNPIEVSLTLISSVKRVVYVGGEVKIPGPYPLADSMTVLKAIMEAGGTTPEGDLNSVVLVHYDKEGKLIIYKTNLKEVLENNKQLQDLALAPQDVIYVPKSGVSKANQFIDQYINKMLPFTKTVNYNYDYNANLD